MTSLPRVRVGLLQHPFDEQVLVYDPQGDRVHLLDATTACVLTLLEEGGWTREGINAELSSRLGVTAAGGYLPLALEELRSADLLQTSVGATSLPDVTRRELLKKMTLTGAAALLVPAIVTYTASAGYAQGSGAGNLGPCAACTSNAQCASNNCGSDNTLRACGSNQTANGGSCSGSNQNSANQKCCSNKCSGNPGTCIP